MKTNRTFFAELASLDLANLTPLDLKRKIPVPEAAALNSMSPATFERNHPHLIRKVSKRLKAVELGDAINLPPPPKGRGT